ncbi:MAG: ABC transporter ATP-binding protein [Oscillospiraceae bacterium]
MITLDSVNFTYGSGQNTEGLRQVGLTVQKGEAVLLCGPSGCGKTTITRLGNGLVPHYYEGQLAGEITVEQKNMAETPLYETAKMVGSVFQNPRSQFFCVDTASELAFGCENQGLPKAAIEERVAAIAEEMRLQPLMGRSLFKLSGGEKQRIACGSVAVSGPDIFVLDEPSSNLDMETIRILRRQLLAWKAQGKTILIAEHRLFYLQGLIDRVIYLAQGQVQRQYTAEAFYALPARQLAALGLRTPSLQTLPAPANEIPQNPSLFSLQNFHFCYPQCERGFSAQKAELPQNGIIAVVGHNGAGKTTFARCLCGLEKHCTGTLQLGGRSSSARQRLRLCYMVMQDVNHQLFTESVLDEILISMHPQNQERAENILQNLDLLPVKDRHPVSLSGGQKQRVAIASAIASQRDIILFDEPTSGLDLTHMQQVAGSMLELQKLGKTQFVITHDPELICRCCTWVLHLEKGQIAGSYPLNEEGRQKIARFFLEE